jgi:hypothetical protein
MESMKELLKIVAQKMLNKLSTPLKMDVMEKLTDVVLMVLLVELMNKDPTVVKNQDVPMPSMDVVLTEKPPNGQEMEQIAQKEKEDVPLLFTDVVIMELPQEKIIQDQTVLQKVKLLHVKLNNGDVA